MSTTPEGYGLTSPIPSVRRENQEALRRMDDFAARAKRDVEIGDTGRDYFLGPCTVVEVDDRIVTIRDHQTGGLNRRHRDQWMGLADD